MKINSKVVVFFNVTSVLVEYFIIIVLLRHQGSLYLPLFFQNFFVRIQDILDRSLHEQIVPAAFFSFYDIFFSIPGCPKLGFYGPDCSFPCPQTNCRHCHPETGLCNNGCKQASLISIEFSIDARRRTVIWYERLK